MLLLEVVVGVAGDEGLRRVLLVVPDKPEVFFSVSFLHGREVLQEAHGVVHRYGLPRNDVEVAFLNFLTFSDTTMCVKVRSPHGTPPVLRASGMCGGKIAIRSLDANGCGVLSTPPEARGSILGASV